MRYQIHRVMVRTSQGWHDDTLASASGR
jgi:hypothetical protein